jgi:hypothetical protein
VSGISTSHDSKVLLFTTTDMKMFLVNIQTKELLADLLGKATSVDAISFESDQILSTSAEHIFHTWDLKGNLKSAETPIKEVCFYNGRSFMMKSWSNKRGLMVADKREDRKGNLTYVWEASSKNLISRVKSFESTFMISNGDLLIFDSENQIIIHKIISDKIVENIKLQDDVMTLYGGQSYFLSGSLDGVLAIYFYKTIGDVLLNQVENKSSTDLHFHFQ